MSRFTLLLVILVVLGCGSPEPGAVDPPRLPDKYSELRAHDPTPESLKADPEPEPWMEGCYSIELLGSPQSEGYAFVPQDCRLEAKVVRMVGPKTHFRVESAGARRIATSVRAQDDVGDELLFLG